MNTNITTGSGLETHRACPLRKHLVPRSFAQSITRPIRGTYVRGNLLRARSYDDYYRPAVPTTVDIAARSAVSPLLHDVPAPKAVCYDDHYIAIIITREPCTPCTTVYVGLLYPRAAGSNGFSGACDGVGKYGKIAPGPRHLQGSPEIAESKSPSAGQEARM